MEILTPFAGEILVLMLFIFLHGRVFFTRHTRRDSFAVFAPLGLVIMILEMLAWGVRLTGLFVLALGLISTFLNYRSLVRFSQHLFVDTYSVKFFVSSVFILLICILMLLIDIIWRPVRLQSHRYNVKIEREYYSYSFGAQEKQLKKAVDAYDKRNLTLYSFSNADENSKKDTTILFVPDVAAETLLYEPYLILLARAGYTVLAADLYDSEFTGIEILKKNKVLRRFLLLLYEFRDTKFLNSNYNKNSVQAKNASSARVSAFNEIYENSYNALAAIAKEKYANKIFIVCDSSSVLDNEKIAAIFSKHFASFDTRAHPNVFNLESVEEYSTPGYGFVAQTNPIFAKTILGVERDKSSFAPSYCVLQTRQKIGDN